MSGRIPNVIKSSAAEITSPPTESHDKMRSNWLGCRLRGMIRDKRVDKFVCPH